MTSATQAEGDTQPISQRVLDEFASKSRLENAAKHLLGTCDGTCNTNESSLCSYHQGQTGFVDLVGGFEQPLKTSSEDPSPENNDDELDPLSPILDVRAELYPESKRFQQPKTPATNGKKRNHAGEIIHRGDSSSKPPINPFAGNMIGLDAMMDPSQAFKATQAASSPLTHVPHSDTLSERPSPDMYSIQRPVSTRVISSSPQITGSRMVRAVTEPQATYISMQESQAKRERLARRSAMELGRSGAVSSDEDFDSDDSQLRRRRNRRKIDLKARDQLIGVTAPPRPVSSGRGRGGVKKQVQSREYKFRSGREASEALVISDDLPAEGNVTEDETEHEEDQEVLRAEEIDELADDNKENIEVPMTVSRPNQRKSPGVQIESTPSRSRQINTLSSSAHQSKPLMSKHENGGPSNNPQNVNVPEGTQTSAVADSQPQPNCEKIPQHSEVRSRQPPSSSPSEVLVPKGRDISVLSTSRPQNVPRGNQAEGSLVNLSLGFQNSTTVLPTGSLVPSNQVLSLPVSNQSNDSVVAQNIPCASKFSVDNTPPGLPGGNQSATSHQDQRALETQIAENAAKTKFQKAVDSSLGVISLELPSTIPETSSAPKHIGDHSSLTRLPAAMQSFHSNRKSSSKTLLETLQPHASTGSTTFETARTSVLKPPSRSPYVNHQHHSAQDDQYSSARSVPAKSLAQIAVDASPLDTIGEVDVDIDLLTRDDIEFQTVIDGVSPPGDGKKRRRRNKGYTLQAAQPHSDVLSGHTNQNAVNNYTSPDIGNTDELAVDYATIEKKKTETEPIATSLTKTDGGSSIPSPAILTPSSQDRPKKVRRLNENKFGSETGGNKNEKVSLVTRPVLPVLHDTAVIPGDSARAAISDRIVVASDRVFAHFNGNPSAYFPATCTAVEPGDKPRYVVVFDDYQKDTVGGFNVRSLELRVGDTIKVLNSRKETFIVQGFTDRYLPTAQPNLEDPSKRKPIIFCDVFGFQTVIVSVKRSKSFDSDAAEQRFVPLKDVYLTQTMWGKFKDRPFIPVVPESSFELQTSSEQPSSPFTPTSKNRRTKASILASPNSTTSSASTDVGLFAKTVFAVTFASDSTIAEETRANLTDQILSNGGRIVDSFEELFDIPTLKPTSSFKQSPKKPAKSTFRVTQAARTIGFACVISDKHCRKAKYIQALALGIPCLATRWVDDCISKQQILPYDTYLLAAGESEYLRGAIRSRVLQPYHPKTANLSQFVANGPKFLAGKSILLIMSKTEEETMRFYPLFTHALGACKISRALSLEAAAKAISKARADGEPWDFVYSHDHDKKFRGDENRRRVERYLLGTNSTGQNRKRGRDEDGTTRVVGNEFLIQSLILGQLAD